MMRAGDYIPQKEPFVMVVDLIACGDGEVTTSFVVSDDCLFVENGKLLPYGILENIAQTCAAGIGYANSCSNQPIKIGFIGSIRNFEVSRLPKCGEKIITCTNVLEEVFSLTLINAEVRIGDELIASTEMKIALSDVDSQAV